MHQDTSTNDSIDENRKLKGRAFGPAADEFGKALAPLGTEIGSTATLVGTRLTGAINGLVFGYDAISEWLQRAISKRLESISQEKIVEPDPRIAVPAIQALTYSMNEEHVRDMFASLLATNMNSDTNKDAHPAFTQLIKEMTSLDALVLQQLRSPQICFRIRFGKPNGWRELGLSYTFTVADTNESNISLSLNNLVRLGLVRETTNEWSNIPDLEKKEKRALKAYANVAQAYADMPSEVRKSFEIPAGSLFARRDGYILSQLGKAFLRICLP
jgi:Abortive infection alpha